MPAKTLSAVAIVLCFGQLVRSADDKPKPKVNFQDNVAAIFQSRCNSCHNADKAKGGLALETFGATMQGGSSGKVVEPGDLENSHLWQLVSHAEEPKMPPSSPKIPDAELATIKAWIEAGAPETSGSVVAMKAKPKFEFKLDPSSMGKPAGPPAMPENVSTEPVVVSPKANAIVAMASSPWAPLVAVAGHKQVLLYQAQKNRLVGVLPFPEGMIHALKFSRNGALLLAGGGRGGQSGLAVVFDVKTGKRVFEIGKEYDVVIAADISPDHGQVALGGPSKVVRVYNTSDGQLQFEMKKHTEWITAMEFSPDGVLLATGDRNNGLVVWEAQTGREFFDLRGHTASITDVTWRLDSNVVASASEDGTVRLWEMENGSAIKAWNAHGGGVASARFAKDGRIVTTGRDHYARVWDQNGGKQKEFERFNDLALRAVFANDETRIVAGDWSGEVRVFDLNQGQKVANLLANPAPIASRLEQARAQSQTARALADVANRDLIPLQTAVIDKVNLVNKAQQALNEAQQDHQRKLEIVTNLEKIDVDKAQQQLALTEALKQAQLVAEKANAEKLAAEKAIVETTNLEKTTSDALAGFKVAVEKALNDKVSQDQALASSVEMLKSATTQAATDQAINSVNQAVTRTTELTSSVAAAAKRQVEALVQWNRAVVAKNSAPGILAAMTEKSRLASETVKTSQTTLDQANLARKEAAKLLADSRAVSQAAKGVADARKAELDVTNVASASAQKALNERKPAADVLSAKASDCQAEVDALTSELKQAEVAKTP